MPNLRQREACGEVLRKGTQGEPGNISDQSRWPGSSYRLQQGRRRAVAEPPAYAIPFHPLTWMERVHERLLPCEAVGNSGSGPSFVPWHDDKRAEYKKIRNRAGWRSRGGKIEVQAKDAPAMPTPPPPPPPPPLYGVGVPGARARDPSFARLLEAHANHTIVEVRTCKALPADHLQVPPPSPSQCPL